MSQVLIPSLVATVFWGCLSGCGGGSGATDGGTDLASIVDGATSGPVVPANGWTKAIADSDIAASITSGGMTFENVAKDPAMAIGAPDGINHGVALGDKPHYFVADLGLGLEAFDGPGEDIVVREIDFQAGGFPEGYAVSVSNSTTGPFMMLGSAVGSGSFDLASTGLASARYVKVESTLTADEIVNGFGLPTYPGAEIDAVGTYYPGMKP